MEVLLHAFFCLGLLAIDVSHTTTNFYLRPPPRIQLNWRLGKNKCSHLFSSKMASPPSKCEVPVPVSSSYLLVTIGSKRDQSNKKALVFNFIRSGQISTKRLSRHSHAMFWCVLRNDFVRNLSECDLAKKVFIRAILASSSICRPTSSQRRPKVESKVVQSKHDFDFDIMQITSISRSSKYEPRL